ncbi:MAG: putative LPS assembly protein LptD, partial [Bacteroidales bacterium]
DNSMWIEKGKYTTCDKHDPHYQIQFNKAYVIPSDKIVTGPANLIIENIPTPVWVPFGIFPNNKEQANGILMPSIGETQNRGFFLRDGGYYWGFSDYVDIALRGDVYSRGSWAAELSSRYNVRYKYSGALSLQYSVNKFGDPESPDFEEQKEFFVRWNHQQSPKARPNSSFNASVNAGSMEHNRFNPGSAEEYLKNEFTSTISYSTLLARRFNLSVGFRHSQNTISKQVDLMLPQLSLSMQRFYPFRKKQRSGMLKWYENITMSYTMNAKNEISTTDSLIFESDFKDFRHGIKHNIPIRSNIKVFNHLNFTNRLNINGYWYSNSIRKHWNEDTLISGGDTIPGYLQTDTVYGFTQGYDFSYNSGLNTKLYGLVNFRKGPVKAVRHVLTPSVNFSYRPDFGTPELGYYKEHMDGNTRSPVKYSIFSNGIYGGPPQNESGRVSFSLQNNLESKIKDKNDTATGTRKLVLLKNLSLNMSYDIARDSLNWSPLSVSGNTNLFDAIDLRFIGTWDPYAVNEQGKTIDVFEWNKSGKLFRRQKNEWALNFSYRFNSADIGKENDAENDGQKATADENNGQIPAPEDQNPALQHSTSFDHKWNMGFNYTFRYTNIFNQTKNDYEYTTIQTLGFNANFHLTDKWRIGVNSGWDFEGNELSYTSLNVYRDLHCWEMMFNWIPTGFRKSYNLTIRVKAPALHDLKLTKRRSHLDYY